MPILYLERRQATIIVPGQNTGQTLRGSIDDLPNLLSQNSQKGQQGSWRILLADDLVYQDIIPLPPRIHDKKAYLAKQLSVEIPDKFEKHDWGFTVQKTADGYRAIIFAPIPNYWREVRRVLEANKLPVEALMTVSMARSRNEDILTGATQTTVDKKTLQTLLPQNTSIMTTLYRTPFIIIVVGVILIISLLILSIITWF